MRKAVLIMLGGALLAGVSQQPAKAVVPFFNEFKAKYVKPDGTDNEKTLAGKVEKVKCNVCHKGTKSKKDKNPYGTALDDLLDRKTDIKDKEKIRKALDTVYDMKSDAEDDDSPTFGELISEGKLPGGEDE